MGYVEENKRKAQLRVVTKSRCSLYSSIFSKLRNAFPCLPYFSVQRRGIHVKSIPLFMYQGNLLPSTAPSTTQAGCPYRVHPLDSCSCSCSRSIQLPSREQCHYQTPKVSSLRSGVAIKTLKKKRWKNKSTISTL